MSNDSLDDSVIAQLTAKLEELESTLVVTPNDEEKLNSNPNLLVEQWNNVKKAILLHHFDDIMLMQVIKARKGDTTSAKFVTDFSAPQEEESITHDEPAKWESLALQLANQIGYADSPEQLVIAILSYYVGSHHDYELKNLVLHMGTD